jgi:uncharacterized protein (TIGR02145 family)
MKSIFLSNICKLIFLGPLLSLILSCEKSEPKPIPRGQSGTVSDIEGNVYKTIEIGTQIWMAENLKTSLLNDSSSILDNCSHIITVLSDTGYINVLTTGLCWYDNITDTTKNHFGALYNFYAVETEKLCPIGWHVPNELEWNTLTDYLGGKNIAGGYLKESGFVHWDAPNKGATNQIGFNALPGGRRYSSHNTFFGLREFGYWWTSTSKSIGIATARYLSYDNIELLDDEFPQTTACSIRCVKN